MDNFPAGHTEVNPEQPPNKLREALERIVSQYNRELFSASRSDLEMINQMSDALENINKIALEVLEDNPTNEKLHKWSSYKKSEAFMLNDQLKKYTDFNCYNQINSMKEGKELNNLCNNMIDDINDHL